MAHPFYRNFQRYWSSGLPRQGDSRMDSAFVWHLLERLRIAVIYPHIIPPRPLDLLRSKEGVAQVRSSIRASISNNPRRLTNFDKVCCKNTNNYQPSQCVGCALRTSLFVLLARSSSYQPSYAVVGATSRSRFSSYREGLGIIKSPIAYLFAHHFSASGDTCRRDQTTGQAAL